MKYFIVPINRVLEAFQKTVPWKQSEAAEANLNARARALILYSYANSFGALVAGTGNKSEFCLGYFTKYGDAAADFFPIGALLKKEVRALALRFGLPNAERPDSQGLCFLGPISMGDLLTQALNPEPGDVIDKSGNMIGRHRGAVLYTLGKRHGFKLFSTQPEMPPHFVVAKDAIRNTVTVSASRFPQDADKTVVLLTNTNWIGDVPAGVALARFRYRQKLIEAELSFESGREIATINQPHYMAVGQSLVLYRGDRCLGGGVIESATLK